MTGREVELDRIEHALSLPGGGVLLVGPPGVGKTRLAREALARISRRGLPIAWVVGSESSRDLPLGAFAGVLARFPDVDPTAGVTAQLAHAIRRLAPPNGTVVLGIDDVQLLDSASAVLVNQLMEQGSVRVVLTQRTNTECPDAISSLSRNGRVARIDLAELSDEHTDDLIDAALDAPIDRAARRALRRAASGNPLYLRQLIQGGLDDGWLTSTDGLWLAARPLRLPPTLFDLVSERIGAVSDDAAELLDILAIAEPLTLAIVESMVGAPAVERSENHGLVTVEHSAEGPALVRLAHPLFGEARRAALGAARARRLRGRTADAMADPALGQADDVLRRAVLSLDAGHQPPLDLLLDAVNRAADLVDVPLAYRLATASVRAGAGFETQAYLANLSALIPGAEPGRELDRLVEMASDDGERARAAVMRIAHLAWEKVGPEAAEAELRRARSAVRDPAAVAHIDSIGALFATHQGRPAEAIAIADRLLEDPQLGHDSAVLATSALVSARACVGRIDGLAPFIDRALADATTLARGAFRTPLIASYAFGQTWAGYLSDAEQTTRGLVDGLRDTGPVSAVAACVLGKLELALGHPLTAVSLLREAKSGLLYFGGWKYSTQIALTHALALRGTVSEAVAARDELNERVHATMRHWEPERLIANAMVEGRLGATTAAIALATAAADYAREHGQFANETVALQTLLMFASFRGRQRLEQLVGIVDGPRAAVALAHSHALAASDPAGLLSVAAEWEACGDLIAAATAGAQSFRFATQGAKGVVDRRVAARAQRLTADLIDRCEDPRTPELDQFIHPSPLTAREREVVSLVGSGLSNRQIAERLHVSVRTVEGHVYRAGDKLGLGRAEFVQYRR